MTTSKPDTLEQVSHPCFVLTNGRPHSHSQTFLKLEEESERRALEAEGTALSPDIPDLGVAAQRAARQMRRHRGSVSVSRFGHVRA